ncbi:transcriptional regulator TrmB [Actinophytocola xinjiangensis]|uniref:Transcriptional regulator TrmB n=1 Tax=Actinophytocola xinjiangensis TaxID=485602 RepID=A0A7Z0WGB1_9PSEU|nr:helix-turn-helix domain-containing protein [Actinophytocola xinjiangensis]OLF05619.1 transcriptional regulator TrmB [Actinophytocola xinjiangensis]
MLEPLGITEFAETVYRSLLAEPGSTTPELTRRLDRSERAVRRAVAELEHLGLASRLPGRPVRLAAARPDTAIDLLVARRRSELDAMQRNARALAREMADERQQPDELFEILVGQQAVADRFTQLVTHCQRELMVFDRPPYAADVPQAEQEVSGRLREHLTVRGLYAPESLEYPGALAAAKRAVANGEQSRMHPRVPMKLAIADRSTALLPLVMEDMVASALVIRPCALLDALVALFELLWDQGTPLIPEPGTAVPPDAGLLALLAAGAKDETIARELGISSRTVTRRVGELLDELGARTRFQAGVFAQRENWLR